MLQPGAVANGTDAAGTNICGNVDTADKARTDSLHLYDSFWREDLQSALGDTSLVFITLRTSHKVCAACALRRYALPVCRVLDSLVPSLPLFCQSLCLALIPVPLLSLLLVILGLPGIL